MLLLLRSGGRQGSERLERLMREEGDRSRQQGLAGERAVREEMSVQLHQYNEAIVRRLNENSGNQLAQLETFAKQLQNLTQSNEQKLERMRETMQVQIGALQEDNSRKLEAMRQTVDEKLHATLEKRLGESFQMVSDRLEQVHKGLGEMQTLAAGVGDLKKVLTNVKTRGMWGEIQLGMLLEQILAPGQFEANVATKPGCAERVEFAIVLPGRGDAGNVYLPVDAKFPQEDYQRLLEAQEAADAVGVEAASKALEIRIKAEAKDIRDKYLSPPHTTDFGILFLPVEGLYAEVLRRTGLYETLMREYHVTVAGPTTLAAILNSFQMGFRTLAIEKRSSEVWMLLSAVKTEFGKFGDILDKTNKKLLEASNVMDDAARKSRTIERKLRGVQSLPDANADKLLEAAVEEDDGVDIRPPV
ncbi:MAG TPA: DNA recombination protein RmuC [Negativicutes bacterium]|nr:DNA recombination protein RmuC [Negativicutes bacterium]